MVVGYPLNEMYLAVSKRTWQFWPGVARSVVVPRRLATLREEKMNGKFGLESRALSS